MWKFNATTRIKKIDWLLPFLPWAFLFAFSFIFSYDLTHLKRYLNHPEYVSYYPAFRHWFLENLKKGHFPLWNPYWGLGHSTEIEASFPIDLYTLVELAIGPRYHWFYLIQASLILGIGYRVFKALGFGTLISLFSILCFFLSPWVNYFFLYWIKANSFTGLFLCFLCSHWWFKKGKLLTLPLLSLATAFSLMGTKLDFWFFHFSFFALYLFSLWLVVRPAPRKLLLYSVAVGLGIATQAWQIIPLFQILKESDRLGTPLGLNSLFSIELYYKLLLSVASSHFLKLGFVLIFAYSALASQGMKRVSLGLFSSLLFVALYQWRNPLLPALFSPYGLGAFIGFALYAFDQPKWRNQIPKAILLFLALSYYWCRPEPGDIHELSILHKAPALLKIVFTFSCALGCTQVARSRFSKTLYFCIIALFLIRDQGQVLLSYFFGLVWIPTRDNYLFEFCLAALGATGLSVLSPLSQRITAGFGIVICILAPAQNYYYSHPLIEKTPAGYPFFKGNGEMNLLMEALSVHSKGRVFFLEPNFAKDLSMYGSSLMQGVRQTHQFSSFIPKRFHDWSVFHWFGFKPEDHWASYEGEYSQETIAKLPDRNTKGIDTNNVYWYMLHAMPPPQVNALRILGVDTIISENSLPPTSFSQELPLGIHTKWKITQLKAPLPRLFTVETTAIKTSPSFNENLNPTIEKNGLILEGKWIPLKEEILSYENPEHFHVTVNTAKRSRLVLTELYHSFWKVSVDGVAKPMMPALHLFRSIELDPGHHEIDFYCEVPFFKVGVWISLISLAVILTGLANYYLPKEVSPPILRRDCDGGLLDYPTPV